MARQTVLLVYGGESAERETSVRSARSVYAAMDGEKYEALLCYIDERGKWWLLEHWTDNLAEHGGAQLVAALGSHSFLVLPGNALIRPDIILPLCIEEEQNASILGLAHALHVAAVGPRVSFKMTLYLENAYRSDSSEGEPMGSSGGMNDGDRFVVALAGKSREPLSSRAAYSIESETSDDALRSVTDERLAERIVVTASHWYAAARHPGYALITLRTRGDNLVVVGCDVFPEMSTSGTFLKLWRMSGVHYPEVIETLISTARR